MTNYMNGSKNKTSKNTLAFEGYFWHSKQDYLKWVKSPACKVETNRHTVLIEGVFWASKEAYASWTKGQASAQTMNVAEPPHKGIAFRPVREDSAQLHPALAV